MQQIQPYFIISLLASGLIILGVILHHYWRPFMLVCFGRKADAIITDFITATVVPASLEEFEVLYPVFSFETSKGEQITKKYETLRTDLVKGARIKVWYDADDPARFFPGLTLADIIMCCLGISFGTVIVAVGIYQLIKQ